MAAGTPLSTSARLVGVVSAATGTLSASAAPSRPQCLPSLKRIRVLKSRMREICTSGSVGASGEQSPGATRPPTRQGVHHVSRVSKFAGVQGKSSQGLAGDQVSTNGDPVRTMLVADARPLLQDALERKLSTLLEAARGFNVRFFPTTRDLEREIEAAEVVACLHLEPGTFARAKRLRWIHDWSAGVDRILFPELRTSNVTLTCSKGNGAVPLAEHAILLMLMLSRHMSHFVAAQQARRWAPRFHSEMNEATVGIIGMGHSGGDLALKCKAFHMKVLGLSRSGMPHEHVDRMYRPDGLRDLLSASDFVVVSAPLTSETKGMVGEAELKVMKPGAFLIVFSRGGIVRDEALLKALREGWIAGAALDAHSTEPLPSDSPFWNAPNTIITPHAGALTPGLGSRAVDIFVDNIKRYVVGGSLRNQVDMRLGY